MGPEGGRPAAGGRPWEKGRAAALVVHYRCLRETRACLESLARFAPGLPVIVVDNGSGDGSGRALEELFHRGGTVRVITSKRNLGFGGGCNLGIRAALETFPALEHLLLLNPDCRVEKGFLEELLATASRRPRAGIVGGRILSMDGRRVLYENGRFRPFTLTRCHVPAPPGLEEYETEFVTGAFMLVSARLLREGLRFDESYFLYVEDMDFCREVRERGWSLWVNRRARVRHAGGGTQGDEASLPGGLRPRELYFLARNKVLFARKRLSPPARAVFLAAALVLKPLAGLIRFGSVRLLRIYFRGVRDGLAGRTGPARI